MVAMQAGRLAAEALVSSTSKMQAERLAAEALVSSTAKAQAERLAAEALVTPGAVALQAGAEFVEALVGFAPTLRVGAVFVEVMTPAAGMTEFLVFQDTAAIAGGSTWNLSVTESMSVLDVASADQVNEAMALSDASDWTYLPGTHFMTETISLSDSTNSTATFGVQSVSEALALADSQLLVNPTSVGEAMTLADAANSTGTVNASVSESMSLEDWPHTQIVNVTVDEAIALADTTNRTGTMGLSVAEALTLAEVEDRGIAGAIGLNEAMSLVDTVPAPAFIQVNRVFEVFVLKDEALAGPFTWAKSVVESMSLVDLGDQTVHAAPVSEAMALADAPASSVTYEASVSEAMSAADSAGAYPVTPGTGEYPSAAVTVIG